jgi:large subunit ribosomal protein L30
MALLSITLVKSPIGYPKRVRDIIYSLGLHKINSSTVKEDNAVVCGMINKISHMLKVTPVDQKGE